MYFAKTTNIHVCCLEKIDAVKLWEEGKECESQSGWEKAFEKKNVTVIGNYGCPETPQSQAKKLGAAKNPSWLRGSASRYGTYI